MKIIFVHIVAVVFVSITYFTLTNSLPAKQNDVSSVEMAETGKKFGVQLVELEPELDRYVRKESLKAENHTFLCTFQGQIAIPNDCKKYHICSRSGVDSTLGICIAEKRFHHQRRTCLKISEAECIDSMCNKTSDKFPDPYLKENYLECSELVPEVKTCPEGSVYDIELQNCHSGSALAGLKESFEVEVENQNATIVDIGGNKRT